MSNNNIHLRRKAVLFFLAFILSVSNIFIALPQNAHADSQKIKKQYRASEGITYKNINFNNGSTRNNVNLMQINLGDPYTKVQLGIADPMNKLETLRNKAEKSSKPGNKVIGAINGSFYNLKDRIPVNLISKNNRLVFAGNVHKSKNTYVNEPIAFGINAKGKGLIDQYDLTLNYTYNGKKYKITNTNKPRKKNNTILYTSEFYQSTTGTNQYGTEVVFKTSYHPRLTFGSNYNLEVTSIREAGDKKPVKIPKNGFVLSGHGKASDRLAKMEVGDKVEINVDIDDKWKDSSFMLAGGPRLVKDGKVNMTINEDSAVAKAVAPRTAVAVDKTGKNVFFVTVDGRQDGSPGMNLKQFATYLASIGADRALNLDGGGSTTMVVRPPGKKSLQVANSLSGGFERSISTILMAVDTVPENTIFKDVAYRNSHYEGINWLKDHGIQGYPDNTFGVNEKLKRKHSAIMFTKILDLNLPQAEKVEKLFNDVEASYVYADYIAAVGNADIFNGSNGDFQPEKTMTREQMATTLVNAFGWEENGTHKKVNLANVDPSHKKNVQILADLGITNQLEDFRPQEAVTRGQFATFLYKANEKK
ncbi:phosphodiester glycosidase family protein [Virgibacillus sp. FSP13]